MSVYTLAEVNPKLLSEQTRLRIQEVPEFAFIQEIAHELGVKVYLFGGSAAAFGHYIRWDLEREAGDDKYQAERFDYDFTNIYRGNQDLDIVVDGDRRQVQEVHRQLIEAYPHFIGSKDAWEVRSLRTQVGDKQPLLENPDFLNQHSDSNSIGMIALNADEQEIVYRDLLDWENSSSEFLSDIAAGRVKYLFNPRHEQTSRYKDGKNPAVLSAIRFLAKVAQYEVEMQQVDFKQVKKVVEETDWKKLSDYTKHKLRDFGLKTLLNAPNSEYAWNLLEESGFRKKLIAMDEDNANSVESLSWWLNKEPLRTKKLGKGSGEKAADLFKEFINKNGNIIVSHETNSFQAYDNITRSSKGEANAFISRKGTPGEGAAYGDGFYTALGLSGARGTNLTIRFILDPEAREGTDFIYSKQSGFVVVKNKKALRLIQENLNINVLDFLKLLMGGELKENDKGLLEKFQRKFSRLNTTSDQLEEARAYIKNSVYIADDFPIQFKGDFSLESFEDLVDFMVNGKREKFFEKVYSLSPRILNQPEWLFRLLEIMPIYTEAIDRSDRWPKKKHDAVGMIEFLSEPHWAQHPESQRLIQTFLEKISLSKEIIMNKLRAAEEDREFIIDIFMLFPMLMNSPDFNQDFEFLSYILKNKYFYSKNPNYSPENYPFPTEFNAYKSETFSKNKVLINYSPSERTLLKTPRWKDNTKHLLEAIRAGVLPAIFYDKFLSQLNPAQEPELVLALIEGIRAEENSLLYTGLFLLKHKKWVEQKDLIQAFLKTYEELERKAPPFKHIVIALPLETKSEELHIRTVREALSYTTDGNYKPYRYVNDLNLDIENENHVNTLKQYIKEIPVQYKNRSENSVHGLRMIFTYIENNPRWVEVLKDDLKNSKYPIFQVLYSSFYPDDLESQKNILNFLSSEDTSISTSTLKHLIQMDFLKSHVELFATKLIQIMDPNLLGLTSKKKALLASQDRNLLLALLRFETPMSIIKYAITQEQYLHDAEVIEASIKHVITRDDVFIDYVTNILMKSKAFNLKHLEQIFHFKLNQSYGALIYRRSSNSNQNAISTLLTDDLLEELISHPNIQKELKLISPTESLLLDDLLSYLSYERTFPQINSSPKSSLSCSEFLF